MYGRHIVVKSLKAGTKVSGKLYLMDALFIMGMAFMAFILKDFVYSKITWLFVIFNAFVGIALVSPSKYNPGKRYYQSIYLYAISNTNFYAPLVNEWMKEKTKKLLEGLNK